jgi:hypothetical protein
LILGGRHLRASETRSFAAKCPLPPTAASRAAGEADAGALDSSIGFFYPLFTLLFIVQRIDDKLIRVAVRAVKDARFPIRDCLRQALRVLKPGGVVLATTVGFVPLTADAEDYWHLSAAGWKRIASRAWQGCEVRVESFGNCLSATAAMMGLTGEELRSDELDVQDPHYPVLVSLFCRKASAQRM